MDFRGNHASAFGYSGPHAERELRQALQLGRGKARIMYLDVFYSFAFGVVGAILFVTPFGTGGSIAVRILPAPTKPPSICPGRCLRRS